MIIKNYFRHGVTNINKGTFWRTFCENTTKRELKVLSVDDCVKDVEAKVK
jgi:hypothetical protein